MKTCIALGATVILAASVAQGQVVIFDQIVDPPAGAGQASQFFTSPNEAFSIGALDDFTVSGGLGQLTLIETVAVGFGTAFVSLENVIDWTVQIYSSPTMAATSLDGDVASLTGLVAGLSAFGDFTLVTLDISAANLDLADGDYWLAVVPVNDFATNGQTGILVSTINDGPGGDMNAMQANPGGGFGFPDNLSEIEQNLAYRITAVPAPGAVALLGLAGLIGIRRRRA